MSISRASLSTEYPGTNSAAPPVEPTAEDGYPSLARLMHAYPDNAILRRFDELNLLHLLRLQAELQDMENTLGKIREEERKAEAPSDHSLVVFIPRADDMQTQCLQFIATR